MNVAYVEYFFEDDGVRYLEDPGSMTPEEMRAHAREAIAAGAVQVCFVDSGGSEAVFERDAFGR